MASNPNPQCASLAAAKERAGTSQIQNFHLEVAHRFTGLSYSQIAQRVKTSEQRIIDSQFGTNLLRLVLKRLIDLLVCTGAAVPTEAEFKAITVVLGVQDQVRIHFIPEIDA